MIPLALITGFLGSGKTTLLRRIIDGNRHRRLAYLVNEFSMLDVDSRRLTDAGKDLFCLPGGSIFCRCLVTSFINQLRDIAELNNSSDAPLQGLVIEASGVADPRVVGQMLGETRLDEYYRLARMVCVVDPGTFPILLNTLPNIAAQIESADLAIVNKTDLFDEPTLAGVERTVRDIQPTIEVARASYAAVDFDLFATACRPDVTGGYAPCRDDRYDREVFATDRPVDIHRLMAEAAGLLDGAYRIKGVVWDGTATHHLDWSPTSRMTISPTIDDARRTELAAVFPPAARERMVGFFNRLGAGNP